MLRPHHILWLTLACSSSDEVGADPPPTGIRGQIVFVGEGEHLTAVSPDGSGLHPLVDPALRLAFVESPSVSPDGQYVAFVLDNRVYKMTASGGSITQLTDQTFGLDPAWSPDGEKIAFVAPSPGGVSSTPIWLMDPDGKGLGIVVQDLSPSRHPSWSPDGTRIAFEQGGGIHLVTVGESGSTALRPDFHAKDPAWSPDGNSIAVSHEGDLYLIDVRTTKESRITSGADSDEQPTWSPTGGSLAFVRKTPSGGVTLWRLDPTTGNVAVAIPNSAGASEPVWAP
jgi:Tol biopolymer transport system component